MTIDGSDDIAGTKTSLRCRTSGFDRCHLYTAIATGGRRRKPGSDQSRVYFSADVASGLLLPERRYRRTGSAVTNILDVDVIAGTHQADSVTQLGRTANFLAVDFDDDVIDL